VAPEGTGSGVSADVIDGGAGREKWLTNAEANWPVLKAQIEQE
jgi:hypothetical protein